MMYRKKPFFKRPFGRLLLILAGLAVVGLLLYQVPYFHDRLSWRLDFASIYARRILDPAGNLPTAKPSAEVTAQPTTASSPTSQAQPTTAPTQHPTDAPTVAPTATPLPLPEQIILPSPRYEKEKANACGPATLAMALRFWGWQGDQDTIAEKIKPINADRNVNVEELKYYVDNFAPGLFAEFRVGGDLDLVRRFLADGMPVMIEESFMLDKPFLPGIPDDLWAGHYLLLTGYDESAQQFIVQDSERGPNLYLAYETLAKDWESFNHVYILIYPSDKQNNVLNLLGPQMDYDYNRQYALDQVQALTISDPTNAYAWFNLGTNLMYFGRYEESAAAYDQARDLGLPQRMLRYQFGPFITYFNLGRIDDLSALADYALKITPNSEEALLWKGWALFRQGKRDEALASFQAALDAHPNYGDALYAMNYVYTH